MIVFEEEGIVVATPTKCGTYTMETVAKKLGAKLIRTLHRMDVPEEYADCSRVMLVRNPWDRLVSVYHYMHNPSNYSQWRARDSQDLNWEEWLPSFVRWKQEADAGIPAEERNTHRSPHLWTNSFEENDAIFQAGGLLRIEHLYEDLKWYGFEPPDHQHHQNRNSERDRSESGRNMRAYYGKVNLRRMARSLWVERDLTWMAAFGVEYSWQEGTV